MNCTRLVAVAFLAVVLFMAAPAHATPVNYDVLILSPEFLVPSVQLDFTAPSYLLPGESYTFTQNDLGWDGMGPLEAFGHNFTLTVSSSGTPGLDLVTIGSLALTDIVGDMYDATSFAQFTIPDQSPADGGGTAQVHYMFIGGVFNVNTEFDFQVSPEAGITPASTVPEPGTFGLLSLAVGGFALWVRRQR